MNASYQQISDYKKIQVETVTPEMLVLMLYDGALRFMAQAEAAFEENNIELINNKLLKTQAIFTELMVSLDKKHGDIPNNLERLYIFFLEKLSEANISKSPKPMLEIKPMVESLRDTWQEAMKRADTAPKAVCRQSSRLNVAI